MARPSSSESGTISIDQLRRWSDTLDVGADASTATAGSAGGGDDGGGDAGGGGGGGGGEDSGAPSRFPVNAAINRKLALCFEDYWRFEADAVVNTTNEALTDRSGLAVPLFAAAGPDLHDACRFSDPCRTGEAVVTIAGELPYKHVVHTVGPRYNEKYRNAAENALHGCYRNCLRVLKEHGGRSIVFPCVYTAPKCYPREDAAHIAVRTVRRFLEMFGDSIDLVVFCVDDASDYRIYQRVLPLYCPRSAAEEAEARTKLPKDTGNELGETIIEDRKIRIGALPGLPTATTVAPRGGTNTDDMKVTHPLDTSPLLNPQTHMDEVRALLAAQEGLDLAAGGGRPSVPGEDVPATMKVAPQEVARDFMFASMRQDPDEERYDAADPGSAVARAMAAERGDLREDEDPSAEYDAIMAEGMGPGVTPSGPGGAAYADSMGVDDLADIAALNMLYQSGTDEAGRPILVFCAAHIPAPKLEQRRVLRYLFRVLDDFVERPFVVVYVHSKISAGNTPTYPWLARVHAMLPRPFHKNLKRLIVVHPTFWLKAGFLFLRPKLSKKFWPKLTYVDQLRQLYRLFAPAELPRLRLPEAVYVVDQEKNKTAYKIVSGERRAEARRETAAPAAFVDPLGATLVDPDAAAAASASGGGAAAPGVSAGTAAASASAASATRRRTARGDTSTL